MWQGGNQDSKQPAIHCEGMIEARREVNSNIRQRSPRARTSSALPCAHHASRPLNQQRRTDSQRFGNRTERFTLRLALAYYVHVNVSTLWAWHPARLTCPL